MSGGNGFGKAKLPPLDNLLVRVKDHTPPLASSARETETTTYVLDQGLLEEARLTRSGQLLLELLSAVDYAGNGLDAKGRRMKRYPVMLIGHKHRQGVKAGDKMLWHYVDGFTLHVIVPARIKTQAPPLYAGNPLTGRV